MKHIRFALFVFAAFTALLFGLMAALPLQAQEPTETSPIVVLDEEGTPLEDTVPNEDEAASLAEVLINAVLASAFGTAPITMFLVSLLKRVLTTVSARLLTAVVALVLAALTAAATYFGLGVPLNSLLDTVATAGPAIVNFIATLLGAPAWYMAARLVKAPVLGYARTPEGYNPRL